MSQKKGRRRKKRKQKKILIGVYTGLILLLAVAAGISGEVIITKHIFIRIPGSTDRIAVI